VLVDADPDDKADIFRQLLRLTYHPERQLMKAQIEAPQHWYSESVRGPSAPKDQCGAPLLTSEFALEALAGAR
jgi:hypothetical protein